MSIEQRVRDIAKMKGIRMAELAEKIGKSHSNLLACIRKNPRLSTIEEIAMALNVRVSDIIDSTRLAAEGIAVIDGKTFVISTPSMETVQIPVFKDYTVLRKAIRFFVYSSIEREKDNALCGYVETIELFNLFFSAEDKSFHLTLNYGDGKIWTASYSIFECGDGEKWDAEDVVEEAFDDIEGVVPALLGGDEKISQADVDKAASN